MTLTLGFQPLEFVVDSLSGEERAFVGNLFWAAVLMFCVILVHIPAHYYASAVAAKEKRELRRKRRLQKRQGHLVAQDEGPCSKWEAFSNTYVIFCRGWFRLARAQLYARHGVLMSAYCFCNSMKGTPASSCTRCTSRSKDSPKAPRPR